MVRLDPFHPAMPEAILITNMAWMDKRKRSVFVAGMFSFHLWDPNGTSGVGTDRRRGNGTTLNVRGNFPGDPKLGRLFAHYLRVADYSTESLKMA